MCLFGKTAASSGVQKSGDARGDYLIGRPLPNFSIERWRMVDGGHCY